MSSDFTTGLYYLQSRYYNPEWGRFMNVDDTSILLATQGETHNANLFAYCSNNPVNNVDYTGKDGSSISLKTFIFYMLVPVCALAERLKEINKEYVLEKSVDLYVTVQADPSERQGTVLCPEKIKQRHRTVPCPLIYCWH